MKATKTLVVFLSLCGCLITAHLVAQQSATEAPAGFDTPTLQTQNAGSQSSSNGIAEPPGDTFGRDQKIFEERQDAGSGLGLSISKLNATGNELRQIKCD